MKKNNILPILIILFYSISLKGIYAESDFISPQQINDNLKETIGKIQSGETTHLNGVLLYAENGLPKFYEKIGYTTIWQDSKKANEAISEITMAWQNGLNPKDYHLDAIKKLQNSKSAEDQVIFDILLSDGLMEYAYNLNHGRLDPESLDPSWNFPERHFAGDAMEQFIASINNDKLNTFMDGLTPQTHLYQLVKDALITYTAYVKNGGWESLSITTTIHPSDNTSSIPQLRNRLIAEGYKVDNNSSQSYDEQLVEQVKLFQKNNGLNDDGVIGKNTIIAFNETAQSKVNKLRINLERSRWVDLGDEDDFIIINIAYFHLYFIDKHSVAYSSKVMVGRVNKQTPIFRNDVTTVVLNPTWTVPFSISSTETLSKLKKDPQYLKKHNMVLLDSKGAIVPDAGIDWNKYKTGHFPYTVRQEPGPHNALGQVKFLFPNKYSVYLHDTPEKYLFVKDDRAFSHGCIRLQNPLNFALFILNRDQPGKWTAERIQEIIKTEKTDNIYLKTKVPIFIMYWTAAINADNQVYFTPDIYNRDPAIIKALN
jgi:murein L,D-transpeptidase YcbB/YkuD